MATKTKKIDTAFMAATKVYELVLTRSLKNFPLYFWERPDSLDSAKEIVKYLFEQKLKFTDEEIKKNFSIDFLKKYKLAGMMTQLFKNQIFEVLTLTYPEFKIWEFNRVPFNFWTEQTAKEAVKWLIEEKLKWSDEDVKKKLTKKTFNNNRLGVALDYVYNNSPYAAINSVYPCKYKQWELCKSPSLTWDKDKAKEAVLWLIKDKLNYNIIGITKDTFVKHGLAGMLYSMYSNSIYLALQDVFPDMDLSKQKSKFK